MSTQSDSAPLRLGIIGAGRHARLMLLPALQFVKGVELVAAATRTAASAQQVEREWRVRCHTGHDALLADETVDAVIVAVPGSSAAEVSTAALRAGKPVLCETPGLTGEEDAEKLSRAIEETDGIYHVAFCLSHAPVYATLQSRLQAWREQNLGPFAIDLKYYEWIHHFYHLALRLGGPVEEVHAVERGNSKRITLTFAGGDIGTIRSTPFYNHGIPYEEVEVTCRSGMLRATDRAELWEYLSQEQVGSATITFGSARGERLHNTTSVQYNRANSLYASGYVPEIEDFVAAVRSGASSTPWLDEAFQTWQLGRRIAAAVEDS